MSSVHSDGGNDEGNSLPTPENPASQNTYKDSHDYFIQRMNSHDVHSLTHTQLDIMVNDFVITNHGPQSPGTTPLSGPFQQRLCALCHINGDTLPPRLHQFLTHINCDTPSWFVNTFGGGTKNLAQLMAREKPSVLYIHHDSELCMFFAFAREYVLDFPLSQQNFKARTWMIHRCKENYDNDFLNVPVEKI